MTELISLMFKVRWYNDMVADRLIIMKKFVLSSSQIVLTPLVAMETCHPTSINCLIRSCCCHFKLTGFAEAHKRDANMRMVGWKLLVLSFAYLASGKREKPLLTDSGCLLGSNWWYSILKKKQPKQNKQTNKQLKWQRNAPHRPSTSTPPWLRSTTAERPSMRERRFIITVQKISLHLKDSELCNVHKEHGLNWLSSAKVSNNFFY